MVERFNAVARRDSFSFEVWFSARRSTGRSWEVDETTWEFPHRYLPSLGKTEHPLAFPYPLVGRHLPDLVVSLYASTAFLLGSELARVRRVRTAYWAEVTFDSWVRRRRWKEALKRLVLRRADAILTAGPDGTEYVRRYGVKDDRIFVVPHVIDFERYARASEIAPPDRDRLREELGLRGTTFIYIGRLWRGKGLAHLIEAYARLGDARDAEVSLLLVGDGPDESWLREQTERHRLPNVVFAGFHQAETLPRTCALADVFVFPTLGDPFGMVVPEAMACGLPVISTSAAGELGERVVEGKNGFIVPPAESEPLYEAMRRFVDDPELKTRMGAAARASVAGQSPEVWADAFEHAVGMILPGSVVPHGDVGDTGSLSVPDAPRPKNR
jgi:glycosyltransferase involved in cell wall biosynthesis